MNFLYASNEGYARHLAVSLYSLLEHNRQAGEITVYVLSLGMEEESEEKIRSIARAFGRDVIFLEMGDLKKRFSYRVDTGGYDISIMARLFLDEALPEKVDRLIYLDCDTVVLKDLTRLWKTPLNGCILGAVMEPTIYPIIRRQIGLGPEDPYYNSGVLLIDRRAWHDAQAQTLLLDFYKKMGESLFAGDQDTINGALKGRIKPLSPVYNFFPNYRYFHRQDLVDMEPKYDMVSGKLFRTMKRHPAIIHYMGDERPWKAGNLGHYRLAYERYLQKTPWAGTPKEAGSRLYLLCYHLMDYLTFVCPPVRRVISRRFGMKAAASKKKR